MYRFSFVTIDLKADRVGLEKMGVCNIETYALSVQIQFHLFDNGVC